MNRMEAEAVAIVGRLREAGWTGDLRPQQALALAEEAGEAVQAMRRYLGMARRSDSVEAVKRELADVVITAYVTAEVFDIPMDMAIHDRLKEIHARPWRETG